MHMKMRMNYYVVNVHPVTGQSLARLLIQWLNHDVLHVYIRDAFGEYRWIVTGLFHEFVTELWCEIDAGVWTTHEQITHVQLTEHLVDCFQLVHDEEIIDNLNILIVVICWEHSS